ncbi:YceK/YidQ family lipoprotein [Pseudomonas sp. UMAB-40]|uniref:YceK/YidQ family lipoprotein n=1 Tax=Pseudomonas sp. UMAB-40 TaxID=1365407 RepID=UPI001C59C1EB|nr:YceK/YidQ family lipoprotein [Pseudomonas sp. UMAB-40]
MINTRSLLLVAIGLFLSGCGTINTVFRSDEVAGHKLKEWKTNCGSIPRVYSGFFYDFCVLDGPPDVSERNPAAPAGIPLMLIDFIPSVVFDTLFLPYTIYRQNVDGNIEIPN